MTKVSLPYDILNNTPGDAAKPEANFNRLESHVNQELIERDGSVAMRAELLLSGAPTQPNAAATKDYVDSGGTATLAAADVAADAGDAATLAAAQTYTNTLAQPTAWAALTLVNGWEEIPTGGVRPPAQYRKVGDRVQVRGAIRNSTLMTPLPNLSTFATLPVGFRPLYQVQAIVMIYDVPSGGGGAFGYVGITAAGAMQITQLNTSAVPTTFTLFEFEFAVN